MIKKLRMSVLYKKTKNTTIKLVPKPLVYFHPSQASSSKPLTYGCLVDHVHLNVFIMDY